MGNCLATATSSKNGSLPREESLHLVPGRIFSNEGRSSTSSLYTQQGRKGINQDAMILWEDFGGDGGILCGVFDGHGPQGHLVARKVRDALPLKLLSFLPKPRVSQLMGLGCAAWRRYPTPPPPPSSQANDEEDEEQGQAPEPSLSAWREAFVKSYKAMDKELRCHPSLDCFCSGSTAVTVLKLGSNLYMGNIGDSRAVLGSKDDSSGSMVAVQLTIDLKPDLPREAERIKRCKGRVFALQDEPEVPRVWLPFDDAPGLAMARAFGDFCLKDYGVISVPEFFHWKLTENDKFVVLASDGVWDVLSNKEVIDIVASSPTRSSAARLLVEAAAREWLLKYPTSKMDDCAVVCLYLEGQMHNQSDSVDNSMSGLAYCSYDGSTIMSEGSQTIVSDEAQSQEPTLDRNFTVRSTGNARISIVVEENGADGAVEDQTWSGLEGVTRVNSLLQLPRFSVDKVTR